MVSLRPGCSVCLQGLSSRVELNGRTGVVIQWLEDRERWAIEMADSQELVRVRPNNVSMLPPAQSEAGEYVQSSFNGKDIAIEPGQLKAQFMSLVRKHGLGAKSDEIADFITSQERAVSCADFAMRFGTTEGDADTILTWLNVGFDFREQYLAPYLEASAHAPAGEAQAHVDAEVEMKANAETEARKEVAAAALLSSPPSPRKAQAKAQAKEAQAKAVAAAAAAGVTLSKAVAAAAQCKVAGEAEYAGAHIGAGALEDEEDEDDEENDPSAPAVFVMVQDRLDDVDDDGAAPRPSPDPVIQDVLSAQLQRVQLGSRPT